MNIDKHIYIQIYLECQTISCMFTTIDDIERWNRQGIVSFVSSQVSVMLVERHALRHKVCQASIIAPSHSL